jgi:hypothetical protein
MSLRVMCKVCSLDLLDLPPFISSINIVGELQLLIVILDHVHMHANSCYGGEDRTPAGYCSEECRKKDYTKQAQMWQFGDALPLLNENDNEDDNDIDPE